LEKKNNETPIFSVCKSFVPVNIRFPNLFRARLIQTAAAKRDGRFERAGNAVVFDKSGER
jgi:hypothetical protein